MEVMEALSRFAVLVFETERAFKIEVYDNPQKPKVVWLPKKEVKLKKIVSSGIPLLDQSGAQLYILKMPKWLAEKRGVKRDTYFVVHRKEARKVLDNVAPRPKFSTYRVTVRIPLLPADELKEFHDKGKVPFYILREKPRKDGEAEKGKVVGFALKGIKHIWEIQPYGVFVVEYEAKRNLTDFYTVEDYEDLAEALGGIGKEKYCLSIVSVGDEAVLHLFRTKAGWVMEYEAL
ncbi:protein of unknown function (plasmid) [Thermococcus nautili]|nr:protein of unknown function [Thermococcus nautili]